ncbi:Uncharacterised protein [Raoultella ornithinolytica]|nr:Uncharacterised protein [Raoultella ornithinolytica]
MCHHLAETGRMERPAGAKNKAANPILFCFRGMFAAQFLQPAWRLCGIIKIKQPGIQDLIQCYLTKLRNNYFCPWIQRAQK